MAQKRMFDRAIIDTDRFMDLGMSSKAMYFLLGMEADDEGFVSYKKVLRIHGGNEDDVKLLIAKKFLLHFPSGVVVVTDWNVNNYLDKNRIRPTEYQTEKSQLGLTEDKKYVFNECSTSIEEYRREDIGISKEIQNKLPKDKLSGNTTFVDSTKKEEEYETVKVNEDGDEISPRKKPQTWDVEKRVFATFVSKAKEYTGVEPEPAKLWQLKQIRTILPNYSKDEILDIFDDWFDQAPDTTILNIHSALSAHNLNKYKMKK